jgi:hypothetical protein
MRGTQHSEGREYTIHILVSITEVCMMIIILNRKKSDFVFWEASILS